MALRHLQRPRKKTLAALMVRESAARQMASRCKSVLNKKKVIPPSPPTLCRKSLLKLIMLVATGLASYISGLHTHPGNFLIWNGGPMSPCAVITIAQACYSNH